MAWSLGDQVLAEVHVQRDGPSWIYQLLRSVPGGQLTRAQSTDSHPDHPSQFHVP
jgi:hypothetical protein